MEIERRITHRLINYWQQIKGDRPFPSQHDIESDEIADMWESCFLIRVSKSPTFTRENSYSLIYLGRALQHLAVAGGPDDGNEQYLATLLPDRLEALYAEMMMTRLPVVEEVDHFETGYGAMMYRQCLCPLGTEDGQIKGIFGGMRYKMR